MNHLGKFLVALAAVTSQIGRAESNIHGSISTDGIASKHYSSLAKISIGEATERAQAEIQGRILEIALESEDGFLVYSVEVQTTAKKRVEILVDAGNGKVLEVEEE